MERPLLRIYNPAGAYRDDIRAPAELRATIHAHAPSWFEVVLQPGDYREELLRVPGTRVQMSVAGEHLAGGTVASWSMTGPPRPATTIKVVDDRAVLERILTAPQPSLPLAQQGAGAWSGNGPLESVVKALVAANAPRAGVLLDIAQDRGRGPNVTVTGRWEPVSSVIDEHLRAAGLLATVTWQPATGRLVLDVHEPGVYHTRLSASDGTIQSWRVATAAPTATRAIVGDDAGSAQQVIRADTETEWRTAGEVWRAAATPAEASSQATAALEEYGPKSGMAIQLAEPPHVHYAGAHGMRVGQRVSLAVGDVTVTDVLEECEITWTPGNPLVASPRVGAWDDSPVTSLSRAVARIAKSVRRTR